MERLKGFQIALQPRITIGDFAEEGDQVDRERVHRAEVPGINKEHYWGRGYQSVTSAA